MKLKLIFLLSFVYFSFLKAAGSFVVPDSLTKGLLLECWDVSDSGIKSYKNPKLGKKNTSLLSEVSGIASWKENLSFLPKVPYYVTLKGYILIEKSRSYIFKLQSSHGSALFIDGELMVEMDGFHEFNTKDAEQYLTEGLHKIEVKGFNMNIPNTDKELSIAYNKNGDEQFDWISPDNIFISKAKVNNLSKNLDFNPEIELAKNVSTTNDYTNSLHPSYNLSKINNKNYNPLVGGIDFTSNGDMIVSSWDSLGQIFRIKNATLGDSNKVIFKRIALGLAEPLGVKVVNDKIYVLQKQELTELIDTDGDELIDEYKTICNAWGATGNFHEFAFGLVFKDGYFYAALATAINPGGKSTIPQNKDRGKAIKIGLDGSFEIIASGLRTPNGIGIGIDNEIFIADNQGDWLPSCKILHLKNDAFYGSYSVDLYKVGALIEKPPVVWLPQGEIGNSASQPSYLNDGVYKGQMIHGDVTHGGLKRVFVEKIAGEYQGIVFPFSQGFAAGVNRICWGPDSALYVGGVGSSGNWGQTNKKWYSLERFKYNNKITFEILAVRAKANGFEIEFTEPAELNSLNKVTNYEFIQWKYEPTMQYGGPKIGAKHLQILSLSPSKDNKKVFVELDGLQEGKVIAISLNDKIKSKNGNLIWANKGWYTMNALPRIKGTVTGIKLANPTKNLVSTAAAKPVSKELSDSEILSIGAKLVDNSGCNQCHAPNKVVLGPSFKMINDKYNSDPATIAKLTEKVYKGGSGVWGDQAMGANTHLDKNEIKKMVRYILALP